MFSKVEICGVNTSKLEVLSEDEKRRLLIKTRQGDKKARERLINGNLKLVLSVIQGFQGRGECADDLFQVGCIGLIKAVNNFNTDLDVKFSTYAVPMILGELRRFLRDNNIVRVSRSMRDTAFKALQVRDALSAKLMRDPTTKEIAAEMGEKEDIVCAALDAIVSPISLDEPVYSDGGDSLYIMDQIKDEVNTDEAWISSMALNDIIASLNERERNILTLRFFADKTQTEVSKEIGISQAQVSRLEKHALEKVRKMLS